MTGSVPSNFSDSAQDLHQNFVEANVAAASDFGNAGAKEEPSYEYKDDTLKRFHAGLRLAILDFNKLCGAVTADPAEDQTASITALVIKVAEELNNADIRGKEASVDPQAVLPKYLEARRLVQAAAQRPGASKTDPKLEVLRQRAEALERRLARGGDPQKTMRELNIIMDQVGGRPDLPQIMATGPYRRIVEAIDHGLAAAQAFKNVPAEDISKLNVQRDSLDMKLSEIMRRGLSVPTPTPNAPALPWIEDGVTVSFHAVLRRLLPRTSGLIWNHLARPQAQTSVPVNPEKVAYYEQMIADAQPRFQADFSKVTDKNFSFVGGFYDGAYASRVGLEPLDQQEGTDVVNWGAGTPRRLRELAAKSASYGFIPGYVKNSPERLTLAALRTAGILKSARPDQFVTFKHFPGGPPELELTENRTVSVHGGFKELTPYLAPFLAVLDQQPPAIMVGHVIYPEWELGELKSRWPDLPSAGCPSCAWPASLSPAILRGYLRDGLGFKGMIVADWYEMAGVKEFVKNARTKLPEDAANLGDKALTIVLAVYAGVNWITSFNPNERVINEIESYYKTHQKFRKLLDELVEQTARLRKTAEPKGGWAKASFSQKIALLTPNDHKDWSDVWSRSGAMTLSFRVSMLNCLSGADFPNLAAYRRHMPDLAQAEENWLNDLKYDNEFRRLYNSVDWEGPEMREAFFRYFQSLSSKPGDSAIH